MMGSPTRVDNSQAAKALQAIDQNSDGKASKM
jgi:hypothetical protein